MRNSRRWLLAVTVIIAGLALAGCGGDSDDAASGGGDSDDEASGGDAAAGEDLYASTCSSCHGTDAKGLDGLGKDLTTSQLVTDSTDAELVDFVTVGRTADDPENTTGVDMPPKGGNPALTDDDLASVVAYVRTLQE